MNARIWILCALLMVFASPLGVTDAHAQQDRADATARIAVENGNDLPVRVYVLQDGHMAPAGLVSGAGSATLAVPPYFARSGEPVRLVLDEIGGPDWTRTDPVGLGPGDELALTIESDLSASTLNVGPAS